MQSFDSDLHVLRHVTNLLDGESPDEFRATVKSAKIADQLEISFDCSHRNTNHAGSQIPFKELFAYFKEEVDRTLLKNESSVFVKSKELFPTLQFLILEFIAILKGDQYQKGLFLENWIKALVSGLEIGIRNKFKQFAQSTAKMKANFETERSTLEKNDKSLRDKILQLETQVKELQQDKRLLILQLDRHKNQLQEYNNFHHAIRQRIRALTELSKHLKIVNHTIPQLKRKIGEMAKDPGSVFVRNCIEQLETATNHINKVYTENDIDYTKKFFEGLIH
jgi:hypothetical protein